MSLSKEEIDTILRVRDDQYIDKMRQLIKEAQPSIISEVMDCLKPKKVTITGAHFDANERSWKIVLSDGSILDGIKSCAVTAGVDDITKIELASYIYKAKA